MRFLFLVFALACLAAGPSRAQVDAGTPSPGAPRGATLSGRVVDANGTPLSDVSVGITELRRGALTGADGRYVVPALPPGAYRVSFQRLGYAPAVHRVVVGAPGAVLDATLAVSALELPGTQVTASIRATTALDSPQPTSVLSGEALREARAATLGGTLEALPGLRSWSTGGGIGKPAIRGLRSDRVVVASEGVRLENQQWGDEHGPQVETAGIERVEVIRGPASVLYGSDALGGVVNVIPRELPTAFGEPAFVRGELHGGYGSGDRRREGGAFVEGARRGLGARASLVARRSDDVGTPGGRLINSGNESATGSAAIGVRGPRGSLDLSWSRREERVEIHEDPAEDPAATPYQRITDDVVRLRALVPLGASRLDLHVGAGRNRRREFEAGDAADVALGLRARNAGGVARLHHPPAGALEGLVGLSVLASDFSKFGTESLIPASSGLEAALFAFEQVEAGRWSLAFGARYDRRRLDVEDDAALGVTAQERTWGAVTGNVGVLRRVGGNVALVANLGRGFRAPSNYDLFADGVHEGTVTYEVGNPDLGVETSLNADAAVRLQAPGVRAELGLFVNRIDDYIHPRPTGTFDPESGFEVFETVQGDARLVGFELSAEAHPTPALHLNAAVDHVRGDETESRTPLPWIPPLRATYGLRLEWPAAGGLREVHAGLRGESHARPTRLAPFDTPVGAYTLAHLDAGFTLPLGARGVTIDLGVRNLFDEAHRDFMSRFKAYALAPGRSVNLRVTAGF